MTGTYREVLRLNVRHSYYQAEPIPIEIIPTDAIAFKANGLLLRRQGAEVIVVTDGTDLPETLEFALMSTNPMVLSVTDGADWIKRPVIDVPSDRDDASFDPTLGTSGPQQMGKQVLALVRVAPHTNGRRVTVHFDAVSSFWAYHVIGPGNESAVVEDPEEEVFFEPIGPVPLPDGRMAFVQRSRTAIPARAHSNHRFSLKVPGTFGPKTRVPVLPAGGPEFVSVPIAGTSKTFVQSNIFISIF